MVTTSKVRGHQRARVIAVIRQAFADTIYPGDDHLTNCPRQNCDECTEIKRDFRGKSWPSLTDVKFLRHHADAMTLMEAPAFRYYLPAFMLAALIDPKTADVISSYLEFGLTPPETEGAEAEEEFAKFGQTKMDYFLKRNRGFTTVQKQAIKAHLELYFEIEMEDWPFEQQRRQNTLHFWETFEG